jgi:hypothetical protein
MMDSSQAYGDSESVLIRIRLRDVPDLRLYKDVGGILHNAYYLTGSGPVPVEIVREGQSGVSFAAPSHRPEAVLDRMKEILGVTDDTYVYRASKPQWIQRGRIGLNQNSVALVHDPYNRPELLTDIQSAYSDVGAAEVLFDSMWQNATKASALENPGLNVSTDEAEILARYGGGPGSERVLIRIRLGDIPNARLYPDVGGGTGDKTIFYVTGEGSSVPVEVYDHAARSWAKKAAVLETNEDMHARIEQMIEESLHGPGNESLRAKLRTRLRAEFSQVLQNEAYVDRFEDVADFYRDHVVATFESRAASIVAEAAAEALH